MDEDTVTERHAPALPVSRAAPALAPGGVVSVGTKLAGATIALMVVLAAVIYTKLSNYQRENLLQAKEMAATAVTRLFADSCAAAIVFGDSGALNDALANLGRGDDVPYAAVWSSTGEGRPGPLLAQLGGGHRIDVTYIPAALESRREAERLIVVGPVRDLDAKLVGVAAVTFSLNRENQQIAQMRRNMLLASGGIAAGITILLLAIARFAIVRPLGKLVIAANKIERGLASDIDVHSRDEIGQLAAAFRSMSLAITSREKHIRARNRDMRLVLDNVGQGFLTLDTNARMSEERSRVVEEWFGTPERGVEFWKYIARVDPSAGERFEIFWPMIADGILPLELCLAQLPSLIHSEGRVFELAYRPILEATLLDQVLVVITDVSARIERERALVAQREMMVVFQHILSDRAAFGEFFDEAAGLVATIVGSASPSSEPSDPASLKRTIHTLKGNCAVYGIESVATYCHELETMLEQSAALTDLARQELSTLWARVAHVHSQFSAESTITVRREEHRALVLALAPHAPQELVATLIAWQYEHAAGRLELMGKQIQKLARRLGKGHVHVTIQPTDVRLPPKKWGPVWAVLSHVVRNAVDHGLELPKERLRAGKPAEPTVTLSLTREEREVILAIGDDGRGIDWQAIGKRGQSLGLPVNTARELEAALFTQGVSSRTEVTGTSGRGVGLNAVLELISSLGGRISIESVLGVGTTFRFHLPESMLEDSPGQDARELAPVAHGNIEPPRSSEQHDTESPLVASLRASG